MNKPTYAHAVNRLLTVAKGDSGASRAAAQVLLATYNGYEFHLDVTDLALLDSENLDAALMVLRCRAELGIEPHTLLGPDGGDAFNQLWQDWDDLRICNRYDMAH